MARRQAPYPVEDRQQILDIVSAGLTAEDLVREFEPSAQTT
jgi:transposase